MFKSRADLLIAAGESIKMQEKHGINPAIKCYGKSIELISNMFFLEPPDTYEFPLAVVEGKPVFVGDELYWVVDMKKIAVNETHTLDTGFWTWNPPKPKTVMVELLREDAESFAGAYENSFPKSTHMRIGIACRKALEETK